MARRNRRAFLLHFGRDLCRFVQRILVETSELCSEAVDMLVPSEKEFIVKVKSSREDSCEDGVRALRAEMFDEALSLFEQALGREPDDHRAAFAAGVACEATQKFDDALRYYRMALRHDDNDKYTESMTRVREYRERVIE